MTRDERDDLEDDPPTWRWRDPWEGVNPWSPVEELVDDLAVTFGGWRYARNPEVDRG